MVPLWLQHSCRGAPDAGTQPGAASAPAEEPLPGRRPSAPVLSYGGPLRPPYLDGGPAEGVDSIGVGLAV